MQRRWAFLAVSLMGLMALVPVLLSATPDEPTQEDRPVIHYMGNQSCKKCHATAYKQWMGSEHARAYVILAWELSRTMVGDGESPQQSKACLRCHATGTGVPTEQRAPNFHIEEGVKCEACHGPGEHHVAMHEAKKAGRQIEPVKTATFPKLKEDNCKHCHRTLESHAMLKTPPFDYEKAWAVIKHGKEPKTKDTKPEQTP